MLRIDTLCDIYSKGLSRCTVIRSVVNARVTLSGANTVKAVTFFHYGFSYFDKCKPEASDD